MTIDTSSVGGPRVLFTAPWEPIVLRRGDALGLRALADQFAESIAPGLSNRVRDGRWVTILAWCLARSHDAFHASGGRSVATRAEQRERYAWLRPLELLWVARTIAIAKDDWRDRTLAGQRRIEPWYNQYGGSTDRFGMTLDQFRAYRQTGMYGGYRLVFRSWPNMTVQGDGWTPGKAAIELADWLEKRLGSARLKGAHHAGTGDSDSLSFRSAKLAKGKEHLWWQKRWAAFDQGGRASIENTLPRCKHDFSVLPEVKLLKCLAFGDNQGVRRAKVAQEIARAKATDHLQICEHLARSIHDEHTTLLPHFSRLADAGMAAMDFIATLLQNQIRVRLADAAANPKAAQICDELMAAASKWPVTSETRIRHIVRAHRFAESFKNSPPIEVLRSLLHHHEDHGGGLRWFVLRNGWIEPRTPSRGGSSGYRFRLWSLCRIAAQCGVLQEMPPALLDEDLADSEDPWEASDE